MTGQLVGQAPVDGQNGNFWVMFAIVLGIYTFVLGSHNFPRNYRVYLCCPSCSCVNLKPGVRERSDPRSARCGAHRAHEVKIRDIRHSSEFAPEARNPSYFIKIANSI